MNAFNTVNLASAVILTSTRIATTLSIPPARWIYPLAGAGTSDPPSFWHRRDYHSSPSLSASLSAALARAATAPADLDLLDIYSCFPIVPKLAAAALGIPLAGPGARPLTLLGGLTSFGGAGNNYSMHALTEMTRQLRAGKGRKGLVLCNGGVLSYMHAVVLSSEPRAEGEYPVDEGLPAMLPSDDAPRVTMEPGGEAVVEVCFFVVVDGALSGRGMSGVKLTGADLYS
jgi:acetyl-CoA acetyltransferase